MIAELTALPIRIEISGNSCWCDLLPLNGSATRALDESTALLAISMGCGMSVEEDRAPRERNIEIEWQINADRAALRNRVKILLSGQLEYLAASW
jgi:hypothetical protein